MEESKARYQHTMDNLDLWDVGIQAEGIAVDCVADGEVTFETWGCVTKFLAQKLQPETLQPEREFINLSNISVLDQKDNLYEIPLKPTGALQMSRLTKNNQRETPFQSDERALVHTKLNELGIRDDFFDIPDAVVRLASREFKKGQTYGITVFRYNIYKTKP